MCVSVCVCVCVCVCVFVHVHACVTVRSIYLLCAGLADSIGIKFGIFPGLF